MIRRTAAYRTWIVRQTHLQQQAPLLAIIIIDLILIALLLLYLRAGVYQYQKLLIAFIESSAITEEE